MRRSIGGGVELKWWRWHALASGIEQVCLIQMIVRVQIRMLRRAERFMDEG